MPEASCCHLCAAEYTLCSQHLQLASFLEWYAAFVRPVEARQRAKHDVLVLLPAMQQAQCMCCMSFSLAKSAILL